MRNVGDVRVELATRTIFNILGPLSNPSQVSRQMVGVFAKQWVVPLAKVLGNLGLTHAWVVHGADGLDEISITGISHVAELKNGQVTTFDISPEDAGLKKSELKDIQGGNPDYNAKVMKEMLAGKSSAFRDIVLFNAAASLIVGGKVDNLHAGIKMAADAIDSGAAIETLNKLIEITNRS